jgi:hypothetical protein
MTTIDINGQTLEIADEIAKVYNHFRDKTDTMFIAEGATELIVKIFSIMYTKDIEDYYMNEKISRSNWTQHTATTFFKTCQQLRFLCDFEVEKRHDGAVRDAKGNVYLCAEWEFDTNSIFNIKGELDKLYETCSKHLQCDAMLFTYKVENDYNDFAEKVFIKWNSLVKKKEDFKLFLLTALLEKNEIEKINYFIGIRVLVYGNNTLDIWDDFLV